MGVRVRGTVAWLLALLCLALALPVEAASLEPGAEGGLVVHLQRSLRDLGLYRGVIDGEYGAQTAQAVMAFHKHLGLERTFDWQSEDWRYLDVFQPPDSLPEDQVVIDLDRQLLYLHLEGTVSIIPVSSGNGELYRGRGGRLVRAVTPEGSFSLRSHVNGMRVSYLGALWRPWYFRGGYAIHGSSSVPGYPASHGCVRVPNWEADWLAGKLRLGMPVTVGRSGVSETPSLPAPATSQLVVGPAGWEDVAGRLVN